MRRIKKRYAIGAIAVVFVAVAILLWCKFDGVVSVHRGFRAANAARVHSVRIHPSLHPLKMRREPGVLFKQRLVWSGPYCLRVILRDHDRVFQKARMNRCSLKSIDETWKVELAPSGQSVGWKDFNDLRWTNKFNQTCFHANIPHKGTAANPYNIDLPEAGQAFILDMEFELMSDDIAKSFRKTFTLKLSRNSYLSYSFNRMVAP
jgi:hypothetical protein